MSQLQFDQDVVFTARKLIPDIACAIILDNEGMISSYHACEKSSCYRNMGGIGFIPLNLFASLSYEILVDDSRFFRICNFDSKFDIVVGSIVTRSLSTGMNLPII